MLSNYNIDTFSPHIPDSSVKEIFNSVVRIETDLKRATGFFLKIKIKDRELNSLITNDHVISQDDVNLMKKIYIYYDSKEKEITKQIILNSSERFIRCFPDPKDITVIEIKNYDYIPDYKFLIPDSDYKVGYNSYYIYYLEKFFLAGYPAVDCIRDGERHITSGRINKIYYNLIEFEHTLDTKSGSSGSPICLLKNGKVIGVNKAHLENSPYGNLSINVGTFIGVIIDELEKEYYLLPKINNKYNSDYYSSYKSGLTKSKKRKSFDSDDDNYLNKSYDAKISKMDNLKKILSKIKTRHNKRISKMKNKNFSLFEENNSLKKKDTLITTRSNNFIKKEKKININRTKTPISNNSYYDFKESFTSNYSKYTYTTKENSLTRQTNKSFELKLKFKKRNKKNKNKNTYEVNKNVNNIMTFTSKYNQESIKYSRNDESLNYFRISMETKKVQIRSNKNYYSNISKSYDNAQKNITINNNNMCINISTINNNMISYGNKYNQINTNTYYYYPYYTPIYTPIYIPSYSYYYLPILP